MHPSLTAAFQEPDALVPKMVMGRNEPCWCGSGKKWKKCHKDRHLQAPAPIGKLMKELADSHQRGKCLHPHASPKDCSRNIVKAHTVQRAGGLSAIADKGHVVSVKKGFENIARNEGQIVPALVGIGRASTFMGFCSTHDNKLFEPIEREGFKLDHEAAFLLSFRALAYEYLTKENSIEAIAVQREVDRGAEFPKQVAIQQHLHLHLAGLKRGMRDLEGWKREYDRMFFERDFSSMPHYAIEFGGVLPFVCCGGFHPEVDFNGRQLQMISRGDAAMEHVCVNVSVVNGRSFLAFGWQGDGGPSEEFVRSFKNVTAEHKANYCLTMAVEQLENTYFNPSWWDSITQDERDYLLKRIRSGIGPNSIRDPGTYINPRKILDPLPVISEVSTL